MDQAVRAIERIVAEAGGRWGIVVEELHESGEAGTAGGERFRYALNEHDPFYAASVIKVPIMAAAYVAADRGRFRFSDRVVLRPEDQVLGSGVLHALTPGTEWTVADLVTLMIIVSDNTATNMVIDLVGADLIRETMARHGMVNSRFYNKLMVIPAELEGRNTITAADVVALYRAMARGEIVSWDACRRMVETLKKQQFTHGIGGLLPEASDEPVGALPPCEIATKSGWVTGIVHDTGFVFLPGRSFAMAFLSEGVADAGRARRAIAEMARAVIDAASSAR